MSLKVQGHTPQKPLTWREQVSQQASAWKQRAVELVSHPKFPLYAGAAVATVVTAAVVKNYFSHVPLPSVDVNPKGPNVPPAPPMPPKPDANLPAGTFSTPKSEANLPTGAPATPKLEANLPTGTSSTPKLEANPPTGTSSTPKLEANLPAGTFSTLKSEANLPAGTFSTPKSEANLPTGAPATPKLEANLPTGAPATPKLEANLPTGTSSTPKLEASLPAGAPATPKLKVNLPAGTFSTPKLKANLPAGTFSTPKSEANLPTGTSSTLKLEASLPAGTSSTPKLEANLPTGTSSTPKLEASLPAGAPATPTSSGTTTLSADPAIDSSTATPAAPESEGMLSGLGQRFSDLGPVISENFAALMNMFASKAGAGIAQGNATVQIPSQNSNIDLEGSTTSQVGLKEGLLVGGALAAAFIIYRCVCGGARNKMLPKPVSSSTPKSSPAGAFIPQPGPPRTLTGLSSASKSASGSSLTHVRTSRTLRQSASSMETGKKKSGFHRPNNREGETSLAASVGSKTSLRVPSSTVAQFNSSLTTPFSAS